MVNNNGVGVCVNCTSGDREIKTNLKGKVMSPCQASFQTLLQSGHHTPPSSLCQTIALASSEDWEKDA